MAKITYLFGAGASAGCLPVVNGIPDEIEELRKKLVHTPIDKAAPFADLGIPTTINQGKEFMIRDCEHFYEKVKSHASIDTYAKKLFITKKFDEYRRLKVILTSLFIFLQYKNKIDYRYDSFFASILGDDSLDFKGDIRILSWNYDFQLEKSFSQYSMQKSLNQNQILLNVFPSTLHLSDYKERFSIFKLNGTTGFSDTKERKNRHIVDDIEFQNETDMMQYFIWYYLGVVHCNNKFHPMLSFAWERTYNGGDDNLLAKACEAINGCEILVVVGYSFPFFNREVDRKILASMSNGVPMKIYVQDKSPQNIIDKLDSVLPKGLGVEKTPINAIDQFYLPPEL